MSSTTTYEQLHTQSLLSVNISMLSQNFKTIDSFIKNFSNFQRKFGDMEKQTKATSQDLSNFKMSTLNTFSTINEVLDTRQNMGKSAPLTENQQFKQMKNQSKQLKLFVTESTREINQLLQQKEKETAEAYRKYDEKIKQMKAQLESHEGKLQNNQDEINNIKKKFTPRLQFDSVKVQLKQTISSLIEANNQITNIKNMLADLKVDEFKGILDKMQKQLYEDMSNLKVKFRLKSDISDTLKLQQMLINLVNHCYETVTKKFSSKPQTKKALVFLEKRLNTIMHNLFGQQEGDKEALLATKGWKCISCSKDLGELQGRLDKHKVWSVFPTKQKEVKDKYSGFGAGFQSIVESAVNKKGGDISYDDKGRMTTPFNLTREVTGSLLKPSQSNSKIGHSTRPSLMSSHKSNMQMQSNYMGLFGKNNEPDVDMKAEYMQKEKGLMSSIKHLLDQIKTDSDKDK